jgi:hypothetical protein
MPLHVLAPRIAADWRNAARLHVRSPRHPSRSHPGHGISTLTDSRRATTGELVSTMHGCPAHRCRGQRDRQVFSLESTYMADTPIHLIINIHSYRPYHFSPSSSTQMPPHPAHTHPPAESQVRSALSHAVHIDFAPARPHPPSPPGTLPSRSPLHVGVARRPGLQGQRNGRKGGSGGGAKGNAQGQDEI